jgi:hypothetical protein
VQNGKIQKYIHEKADADTHKKKKEKKSARKLTQISKKNDALNALKLTTESVTPTRRGSAPPFLYV